MRIYPDDIHADSHEPALTPGEAEAGAAYWAAAGSEDGSEAHEQAWRGLVAEFGPERGSWVADATRPGTAPAATRGDSWTRPARTSVLPERWTLVATLAGQSPLVMEGNRIPDDLPVGPDPTSETETLPRWMHDFDEALRVGMAVRIRLPPAYRKDGVDRLVAYGVRTEEGTEDGAARIEELMQAHARTDGCALLPVGTPTNHAPDEGAGWTDRQDPAASLRILRRGPLCVAGDGRDGTVLARALGVDPSTFAHAEHADGLGQVRAGAMNEALWRITWGHGLKDNPILDADARDRARQHFVRHVRGRGSIPSLRVGNQPYGVLPVVPLPARKLGSVTADNRPSLEAVLAHARIQWERGVQKVPHAGRTTDPSADLQEVLGMEAHGTEYGLRPLFSTAYLKPLAELVGRTWEEVNRAFLRASNDALGRALESSPLARGTFGARQRSSDLPMVQTDTPEVLSRLARPAANVRDVTADPGAGLLNHLAASAKQALYADGAAKVLRRAEPPRPGRTSRSGTGSSQPVTLATLDAVVDGRRVLEHLRDPRPLHRVDAASAALRAYEKAVALLAKAPRRELELLTAETLDTCSHRLDAWLTSLAARRLDAIRSARPRGSYVGGYGVVESLRPSRQPRSDGHIHAPSLGQATTAAILRSAGRHRDDQALDLDLASRRIREAQWLLDGIREGHWLGDLLGYRLERSLHEHPGHELSQYVEALREVSQSGRDVSNPTGRVADGLRLSAMLDEGNLPWGRHGLPARTSDHGRALEGHLRTMRGLLDAVEDATLAEAVHQLVQGNAERAGATLDAINRGEAPPPELEFPRTPRTGHAVTYHAVVPMHSGSGAWPRTPRSRAEPRLDGWLAALLGRPEDVAFGYRILDGDGTEVEAGTRTAAFLGLAPADLLHALSSEQGMDLLEAHAARAVPTPPDGGRVEVVLQTEVTAPQRSLADALELLRAARDLVHRARPLHPRDLVPGAAPQAAGVDPDELEARLEAAHGELETAADAVQQRLDAHEDPDAEHLETLSLFGVAAADATDRSACSAAVAEALERLVAVDGLSPVAGEEARVGRAQDGLRALFGKDFVALPSFAAPAPDPVPAADLGGSPLAPHEWLLRAGRVRANLGSLERLASYAESWGTPGALNVAQDLPSGSWVGDPAATIAADIATVVAWTVGTTGADPAEATAGLYVDSLSEVVPRQEETTGMAFQYDAPAARPPQVILLAFKPKDGPWSGDQVRATVEEALDLARLRAVELDDLPRVVRMTLPMIYVRSDRFSTGQRDMLVREAPA